MIASLSSSSSAYLPCQNWSSNSNSNSQPFRFQWQPQPPSQTQTQTRCVTTGNRGGEGGGDSDDDVEADSAVDFFDLFGLNQNFGLDLSELKRTYLTLMTEHHPDKKIHQQQNANTEHDPSITAELITHAYQILKTPHTRALHWLEVNGCLLAEGSPASNRNNNEEDEDNANPQELVGMEFLMEMMEWREAIEDAGADQPKLVAIAKETQILHQTCETALEELLDDAGTSTSHADASVDEVTLQNARQLTAQLQYWHRLEQTLKDAMEVG